MLTTPPFGISFQVCRAFRNKGSCRYGDECKYEHSEGDAIPNPPRGLCFLWKESGECKFGDRCRFIHGDDDERFDENGDRKPTPKAASARRSRRAPRDPVAPREKLDEVCNNYLAGRCRYGENCRRQHPGDVPQVPVEKIDEICNNYLMGRCQFGDMCRRLHQGEPSAAAPMCPPVPVE